MKTTFVCNRCGSNKVQGRAWIDINTKEVIEESFGDEENDTFCPNCMANVMAIESDDYDNICYNSICHSTGKSHQWINDMLSSYYGETESSCTFLQKIDGLSQNVINDIYRRIDFLETLDLAYEQYINLKKSAPTELSAAINGGFIIFCTFHEHHKTNPLNQTVPNRTRMYKNVEELISDIKDLKKTFLFTRLENICDYELPF